MNNTISHVVDLWLDSIWEGYIIEFVVNTTKSYRAIKQDFFKGPRGKILKPLNLCINMLLCEKGISRMNFNE